VRALPRGASRFDLRSVTRYPLALSLLLAVVVVVAAGVAGPAHFGGPRWLPNIRSSRKLPESLHQLKTRLSQHSRHVSPGSRGGGSVPLSWILIGVGVVMSFLILWRVWKNWRGVPWVRPRSSPAVAEIARPVEPEPDPEPDAPAVLSGIELALQVLDQEREPADAIVRAWLGLEETAAESGIVRGPAETPTEFTSRILSRAFADDRAARTLLRLYLRTRFGDHPATVNDVEAARRALRTLAESWSATADENTAGVSAR
jgi:hypothetical protein